MLLVLVVSFERRKRCSPNSLDYVAKLTRTNANLPNILDEIQEQIMCSV